MTSLKRVALLLVLVGCTSSKPSLDASEPDGASADAAMEDGASRTDGEVPPPWPASRLKLPNQIGQRVTYREALGELEDACARAAPVAVFSNGECLCADPGNYIAPVEDPNTGLVYVSCLARSDVSVTFENIDDPTVLETYAESLNGMRVRVGAGSVSERSDIARRTSEGLEARRATDATAGQPRKIGFGHHNDYISTLVVGVPSATDLTLMVEAAFDGVHFSRTGAGPGDYRIDVGIVEPEPDVVATSLGVLGMARQTPPAFDEPDARLRAEDAPVARALREAVVTLLPEAFAESTPSSMLTYDTLNGSGCVLGTCRVFTDRLPVQGTIGAEPSFFATIERVYQHATIGREIVWLDELGKLRGFVVIGPNLGAGLVVLLDQLAGGTEIIAHVYDRKWKALGDVALTVPYAPRYEDVVARAHFVEAVSPRASSVLAVCDMGFAKIFRTENADGTELFERVLFGRPARFEGNGTLLSGSLFGWAQNPHGNAYDFLSGIQRSYWAFPVIGTYSGSDRYERYGADHGITVALMATRAHAAAAASVPGASATSLYIVPVAVDRCFDLDAWREAREWRPANDLDRPGLVGVVNLSFEMQSEVITGRSDCPSSQTHAFESTTTSVLWVAAAGNDHNASIKNSICPLRAMRVPRAMGNETRTRSNGLIVTALDSNGTVSEATNYGRDFSDIAADGSASDTGGRGYTSYASPRVAAAAVLLAQMFPGSPPRGLRAYVLFGARPRNDLRNVVLAGGELDVARAVRFASCWQTTIVPELGTRAPVANDYARCIDAAAASGPVPTVPSQDAIDRAMSLLAAGESL